VFSRAPDVGPLVGAAVRALIYDFGIRNVLIARGATPDPEVADRGVESLDEPGGAA
jgi:glycerol uptake facilitator